MKPFVPADFLVPTRLEHDRFLLRMLTMWVRESERAGDLDALLFRTVRTWLSDSWPFVRITFPGRNAQ